jgi:hypothetical protein
MIRNFGDEAEFVVSQQDPVTGDWQRTFPDAYKTQEEAVVAATLGAQQVWDRFENRTPFGKAGEEEMHALGFLRVSRGGVRGSRAAGLTWSEWTGLSPRQQNIAIQVARNIVDEEGGEVAYSAGGRSSVVSEWPSNEFTAAVRGLSVVARSLLDLPQWAQDLLVGKGGPGSGHFGHAGRPGEVGGSQPDDFRFRQFRFLALLGFHPADIDLFRPTFFTFPRCVAGTGVRRGGSTFGTIELLSFACPSFSQSDQFHV